MSKHYVIHTLLLFLSTLFLKSNPISFVKELDIGASARLTYDSNIFGVSKDVFQNANRTQEEVVSKDDFILSFSPAVHFSKDIYLLNLSGSAGVSITQYFKNRDKSYIIPVTNLILDFDDTLSLNKRISNNAKIRFDASFDLGQQIDTSILDQDLVSYTFFAASLNVRYNHSAKFGLGGSTNYSYKNYQIGGLGTNSYNDLITLPLSLSAFYIYSEKLDVFTSYTTTISISDAPETNAADSTNHAVTFGLNGEYSSKLSGKVGLGYSWIDYDKSNLESSGTVVTSLDLTWKHNTKTTSSYSVSRKFEPTAQGSSTFTTSLGAGVNHKLTDLLRGNAMLNYSNSEFTDNNGDNSDLDQFGISFGLDYNLRSNITVGTTYSFTLIDYEIENYDRHTFEIFASGRF